ncbi:White collar protein 1 [Mycena indigotica]|uniref:White collar protein 1 n=1 Tax=Mycena indigotica TaxID=2126181 RepID=A0A8H6TEP3_9AGAR|nr:White collar protein 1 [Mycena indigotica]KAF7315996.1 White collar protein 1 [Mycena indigotica]
MPFGYLQHDAAPYDQYLAAGSDDNTPDEQDYSQLTSGMLQFHIPQYLFDSPPRLASGGGAEAFHPAQAAAWFTNSGFRPPTTDYDSHHQYSNTSAAVETAYTSLESLAETFPSYLALAAAKDTENNASPVSPSSFPTAFSTFPASPPFPEIPHAASATLGLPIYSQSGFDVVSLLARVTNRPNPIVPLGPIDFTTSFVVADCRRHDDPIVYCSPSFCSLTGYSEQEVRGRNCRFLQAPPNVHLEKGDIRRSGTVQALAKAIHGRKEGQARVVNYRKDGEVFVNLVTVVPLVDEDGSDGGIKGEVVWFVGFQVDLGKQTDGIAKRVHDGTYYAVPVLQQQKQAGRTKKEEAKERRAASIVPPPKMSIDLARLLQRPNFLVSCGATAPTTLHTGIQPDPTSHVLHSLLLDALPDFIHVLSLKGAFLYVSSAVTRVLGWAPAELLGHSLEDICFDRDIVSVVRALKEASMPIASPLDPSAAKSKEKEKAVVPVPRNPDAVRVVDLLFRARTKQGAWVWVESRGRLHVEPGKGRKAIVMIGRARGMAEVGHDPPTETPRFGHTTPRRSPAGSASGLEFALLPRPRRRPSEDPTATSTVQTTFHGIIDPYGLLLSVGTGCSAVLGRDCEPSSLLGTQIGALVVREDSQNTIDRFFFNWRTERPTMAREVSVRMRYRHGPVVDAVVRVAPPSTAAVLPPLVTSPHLLYSVRLATSARPTIVRTNPRFGRLDPVSGSESWQYEISQLRFANERLVQEIQALEAETSAAAGPSLALPSPAEDQKGAYLPHVTVPAKRPWDALREV